MLRKLALAAVIALLAATTASAAGGATATLSSSSVSRRAGLTLVLRPAVLRCGRIGARSLSIALPQAMRVPASISRDTVRVSGEPVTAVRTDGKTIVLSLASASPGATCDSIVVGAARVQLARSAGLVTPARAGTYAFSVTAKPRGAVWRGTFVVHS